jgi:FlaA1/EpsC-like NDP-sugar epimerase
MATRLFDVDVAPLLLVGWQLVSPVTELRVISAVLLILATAMIIRFIIRESPAKRRRVLILGSGPLTLKLVEEIGAAQGPRYSIVGIVADEPPKAGSPAAALWLGPCDELGDIVESVRPARIIVAAADRRDHLPMQSLLEWRVRGIPVEDAVEFYERLTGKIAIEVLRPSVLCGGRQVHRSPSPKHPTPGRSLAPLRRRGRPPAAGDGARRSPPAAPRAGPRSPRSRPW